MKNIESLIEIYWQEIIEARKFLHQHPENRYMEFETQKYIINFLEKNGIKYKTNIYETAVIAYINGNHSGKTIALRADMDALPLKEETECEYKSLNKDYMHACGHDAHMAIMLGTSVILNKIKDQIKGNIKIIFQPAEEQGIEGGAKGLIKAGILNDVDSIFAAHVWPDLPVGQIAIGNNEMMASCDLIKIKIKGKSGHIGLPHQCINPIYVASQFLNTVTGIRMHYIDPFENLVWNFGIFKPDTFMGNAIPSEIFLSGSARTYNNDLRPYIEKKCRDILEGFKIIYDIDYEYDYHYGYAPVVNDYENSIFFRTCAAEVLGEKNVIIPSKAVMTSEDFGEYLKETKGSFAWIGAGEEGKVKYPLHNSKFLVPEKTIENGIKIFTNLALKYLG